MSSKLQRVWWLLVALSSCGGKVVVDEVSLRYELTPESFCDYYCTQIHGIGPADGSDCTNFDSCLDACVHWYDSSVKYGCLEEYVTALECGIVTIRKAGVCGADCNNEAYLWRKCLEEAPEPPPEP